MISYKTKQQDLLFSYLEEMRGKHFTVEDVIAYFSEKNITLGKATIYRQLEKLVADGKVIRYFIDEKTAACFEYTGECAHEKNHFHIKCEKCGKLIHIESREILRLQKSILKEHGITLNPHRTVFYGVCSDCQTEAADE